MIRAYAKAQPCFIIFKSMDKILRYVVTKNPTQTQFLYSQCCGSRSGSGILGEVLYFISFNFLLRI
jgi:hypothetical protein